MVYVDLTANSYWLLNDEIVRYFDAYPPAGYGTYVADVKRENGEWKATVTRYTSCD
jgi:hypothetical protein